ncbi:hypothetical protein [Streptomyces sp. NPDC088725]|uniref:hypothetical protein n=1 Tax=Streptomyces sp. NPDC088725 TaxID=3365873 RepID=UPI003821355A
MSYESYERTSGGAGPGRPESVGGAVAVAALGATVHHSGFWRLPPDRPSGLYASVTRDLLARVLHGLERWS